MLKKQLNNCVVSFYDNFCLIFKGSENRATNDIENWSLLTTPLHCKSFWEIFTAFGFYEDAQWAHLVA